MNLKSNMVTQAGGDGNFSILRGRTHTMQSVLSSDFTCGSMPEKFEIFGTSLYLHIWPRFDVFFVIY